MVGAVGINVSWVFAFVFVIGCFLAGLGGALVAPIVNVTLGMDHTLIMEAFLIVIIGGLGNVWGALLGALIFGLTQSLGILVWPQFGIVFPYAAVVIVLLFQTHGSAEIHLVKGADLCRKKRSHGKGLWVVHWVSSFFFCFSFFPDPVLYLPPGPDPCQRSFGDQPESRPGLRRGSTSFTMPFSMVWAPMAPRS